LNQIKQQIDEDTTTQSRMDIDFAYFYAHYANFH